MSLPAPVSPVRGGNAAVSWRIYTSSSRRNTCPVKSGKQGAVQDTPCWTESDTKDTSCSTPHGTRGKAHRAEGRPSNTNRRTPCCQRAGRDRGNSCLNFGNNGSCSRGGGTQAGNTTVDQVAGNGTSDGDKESGEQDRVKADQVSAARGQAGCRSPYSWDCPPFCCISGFLSGSGTLIEPSK